MKERIYSIPLTDALKEGCGCILCTIEKKLEEDALTYFLGPSMMEPDSRELTNEKGFCRRHLPMLFEKGNRLGLALILETHVKELSRSIYLERKAGLFQSGYDAALISKNIVNTMKSCALCDKLNSQLKDAASNFAYLWDAEEDFRKLFEKKGDLCPEHAGIVIASCEKEVRGANRDEFIEAIVRNQKAQLSACYDELHEFVVSFDYRNAGKPLSEKAKQSVQNAVTRLSKF